MQAFGLSAGVSHGSETPTLGATVSKPVPDRDRDRERDRQTDRDKDKDREYHAYFIIKPQAKKQGP